MGEAERSLVEERRRRRDNYLGALGEARPRVTSATIPRPAPTRTPERPGWRRALPRECPVASRARRRGITPRLPRTFPSVPFPEQPALQHHQHNQHSCGVCRRNRPGAADRAPIPCVHEYRATAGSAAVPECWSRWSAGCSGSRRTGPSPRPEVLPREARNGVVAPQRVAVVGVPGVPEALQIGGAVGVARRGRAVGHGRDIVTADDPR